MPDPGEAPKGVYCEPGCHPVAPKYGGVKAKPGKPAAGPQKSAGAVHLK
jgi:hypothetical protein